MNLDESMLFLQLLRNDHLVLFQFINIINYNRFLDEVPVLGRGICHFDVLIFI